MRRFHFSTATALVILLLVSPVGVHAQTGPDDPVDFSDGAGNELAMPEAVEDLLDQTEPQTAERVALADFVDGLVRAQFREHGLAAMTVSIVRHDEVLLAHGYGLADLESQRPVEVDRTLFRIGSVSKTFTWTAVMMLVERGLLDLDVDVNDYLAAVQVTEAFDQPVTLRHLMHHRAGFEDTLRLFAVADDDPRSLAQLLSEHQPKRIYPPGQRTSYSNWGSALAAQIVEDVTGVSYGDFLREEILDPLGMHDTFWVAPLNMDADLGERLATGYKPEQGALKLQGYMQIGPYWPAGGIAATATDMSRWMRFHLTGGELEGARLLSAETHQAMWTRAFNDRPEAPDLAHGFQDRPYRGLRTLGHGGGTAAFLTNMILVPELELGVFLSHNSAHTGSPIRQLPDLLIDRLSDQTFTPDLLQEGDAEPLDELAGTYLNNRRTFSTFVAIFGAMNMARLTPVSDSAVVFSSGQESRFFRRVPGTSDLFEAASGERMAVIRDAGKVVALADGTGVHTFERTGILGAPTTLLLSFGAALLLALTTSLGGWRRFGRGLDYTLASRLAGVTAFVGVLAVLALVITMVLLVVDFAQFDVSQMAEMFPPASMYYAHYAGWGVLVAAVLMVLGHLPAWSGSGWGWWRRLHFGAFTLALLFLTLQLWQWKVIGAPVI